MAYKSESGRTRVEFAILDLQQPSTTSTKLKLKTKVQLIYY